MPSRPATCSRGAGTVELDGTTYPAVPGSAFHIERGRPHAVLPDEGVTLVAVVYFEPPQLGPVRRTLVPEECRLRAARLTALWEADRSGRQLRDRRR